MKFTLLLTTLLIMPFGFSQSIAPEVVSTSGGDASSTNSQLSWTVGEPIITTETVSNGILTQGFQQPEDISNTVQELFDDSGIKAYPNPVQDHMTLELPEAFLNANLRVFDAKGALIKSYLPTSKLIEIDLSGLSKGNYIIHIINTDQAHGLKFEKL